MTSTEAKPETVHTMTSWYDGPRDGIADHGGRPHLYESMWDEQSFGGCWTDLFSLTPLDAETFELALEDWHIWSRWDVAFKAGNTTLETHPALPGDRQRHEELRPMLSERIEMSRQQTFLKRGSFSGPVETVQWFSTDEAGEGLITYSKLVGSEE